MRALHRVGAVLAVMFFLWGASASAGVTQAIEDAVISARIETSLMFNERLSPFDIKVHTDDGVVTLTGGVSDEIERDLAQKVAESVTGVRRVMNDLLVVQDPGIREEKRGWRQSVEDQTVAASVRTRLLYHKELKGIQIGVRCRSGVVTLFGVVGSDMQKNRIAEIAAETRGVVEVVNSLTVNPADARPADRNLATAASDKLVEKRVESELLLNRYVSVRQLKVDVQDGLCILTGNVGSEKERELAGNIAETTQGVERVRNELRVVQGVTTPPEDRAAPAEVTAPAPSDAAPAPETAAPRIEAAPLAPVTPPPAPSTPPAPQEMEALPLSE